jgi:ATP-dependent exoDNAse (exonuclease V) alpha subunit
MTYKLFYNLLQKNFPHQPTLKQDIFFQKIADFILNSTSDDIFILKGYAGTGKTTIISTVINNLADVNMKAVLLAPTGRAAKVISNYSGKPAYTIHKRIYFPKKNKTGGVSFTLQQNKFKNTLFIVDESSMISDNNQDSKLYENGSLLDDLFFYVDAGNNCKLLLIGDTAQLPPVNMSVSPALDIDSLSLHYQKNVHHIELDEVMRQAEHSGILYNAT